MHPSSKAQFVAAIALLALAGCGGGGGGGGSSGSTSAPVVNASPGGIWQGRDPFNASSTLLGVVTETGEAYFMNLTDGAQSFGTVSTVGNSLSGTYTTVLPYGRVYTDGSTQATGSASGTVAQRSSLTVTFNSVTTKGFASTASGTFTYNSLYSIGSSLSTIAGNYRDTTTGATINVSSAGVIYSQDPVTGCVLNGAVSIINASYNAYRLSYTFSSCRAPNTYLNNTTATGLGVYDNTTNPVRVIIGVLNKSAAYSLVGIYPKA